MGIPVIASSIVFRRYGHVLQHFNGDICLIRSDIGVGNSLLGVIHRRIDVIL